jgi:hypothetical protein
MTPERAMLRTEIDDEDEPVVLPTRTGRYVWTLLIGLLLVGGGAYAYFQYKAPIDAALGIGQPDTATPETEPTGSATEPEGATTTEASTTETGTATEGTATEGTATEGTATEGTATEGTATEGRAGEREGATAEGAPEGQGDVVVETTRLEPSQTSSGRHSSRRGGDTPTAAGGTGRTPTSTTGGAAPTTGAGAEPVRSSTTLDFSQGPVMIRTTHGWATVQHDGRDLGRTPLRVQLPVGEQHLTLRPNGEGPGRTITIDVEWGSLTQVTVPIAEEEPAGTEAWGNPY